MKIAILWTGLSGYLNAFLRELAYRPGVELLVAHESTGQDPGLALGGLIHHMPAVPRPALPSIYRSGSVLSLPSLTEGMPLVVLEAMACPPGGWE